MNPIKHPDAALVCFEDGKVTVYTRVILDETHATISINLPIQVRQGNDRNPPFADL
jgi:hypothetical protein